MWKVMVYARTGIYGLVCLMMMGLAYQPQLMACATCGCGGGGEEPEEDEVLSEPVINKVKCYVLDEEINTSEAVGKEEYKGVAFWFCCEDCVPKFKYAQETYFKKMSADYPWFVSIIFDNYFVVRESLASDSVEGISANAVKIAANAEILTKLEPKLNKVKVETLQKIAKEITKAAQPLAQTKYICPMHDTVNSDAPGKCPKCKMKLSKEEPNIKWVRSYFKNLSNALIKYRKEVDRKEGGSSITAYVFYCPMAKKSWLQEDKEIGNPYYGKSMLKCGKLQEPAEEKE